jgi:cysteinyl-tRNA synthetase
MCSNYTAQDFVRRALRDYFGYNVHFVMNITDIDDKVSYQPCLHVSGADQD